MKSAEKLIEGGQNMIFTATALVVMGAAIFWVLGNVQWDKNESTTRRSIISYLAVTFLYVGALWGIIGIVIAGTGMMR